MILGFDPVASELLVDFETGDPEITVPLKDLVMKYYSPTAGTIACSMGSAGLELTYWPLPGKPSQVGLVRTGERSWRVVFIKESGRTEF